MKETKRVLKGKGRREQKIKADKEIKEQID
jgi:hypothetical protein